MGIKKERVGSKSGRVLALILIAVVALGPINTLFSADVRSHGSSLAFSALLIYMAWLLFWQPHITLSDQGVTIVNLLRTHELPWPRILRIDTRWALELFTEERKYTAWSAPAPGRHTGLLASKDQGEHLPKTTYLAGTVRPGDLVNTDSGAASARVRTLWEEKRNQISNESTRTTWSKGKLLVLLLLLGTNAVLILL